MSDEKHIFLVRHAEYDAANGGLTQNGWAQAIQAGQAISQYFERLGLDDPFMASSPARRTKETATGIASIFTREPDIEIWPCLFEDGYASPDSIVQKFKGLPQSSICVSHDLILEGVTAVFTGEALKFDMAKAVVMTFSGGELSFCSHFIQG